MKKQDAIKLLGGSVSEAARRCRIGSSAVSQWPDELTRDQEDRVYAALWRQQESSKGTLEDVIQELQARLATIKA